MKALSLHQPWATMIAEGRKTIETRRWATSHRGELVICSSRSPRVYGHLCGYALAVARLVDCRPMTKADEAAACCDLYDGAWAWVLADVRAIEPSPVHGAQRLFEVEIDSQPGHGPKEPTVSETKNAAPEMAEVFAAYREIEQANRRLAAARAAEAEAKEALKDAKEERSDAEGAVETARERVIELVGLAAPSNGAEDAEAAPPVADHPLGWIDETTRPGRKFKLAGQDGYVEFRGVVDGKPQIFVADGPMAGENFFPAGDVTVEQWNADWAPKVEGFRDAPPVEGEKADAKSPVPEPASPEAEQSGADPDDDESWRPVRLDELTLPAVPPRVLKALRDHEPPIETIGDLVDWQKAKGHFWAKDISGIGPTAQEQLADALEAFWGRRKRGQ